MAEQIILCLAIDYKIYALKACLIFVLVEQKIFFGGIVGPDVFDTLVGFAFIFYFLKVLYHFKRCSGAHGIVYEFVFRCGPGSVFEFGCQFECPVHGRGCGYVVVYEIKCAKLHKLSITTAILANYFTRRKIICRLGVFLRRCALLLRRLSASREL